MKTSKIKTTEIVMMIAAFSIVAAIKVTDQLQPAIGVPTTKLMEMSPDGEIGGHENPALISYVCRTVNIVSSQDSCGA